MRSRSGGVAPRAAPFPLQIYLRFIRARPFTFFKSTTTHAERLRVDWRRGVARAEDAQGAPNQSHISPSLLVSGDKPFSGGYWGVDRARIALCLDPPPRPGPSTNLPWALEPSGTSKSYNIAHSTIIRSKTLFMGDIGTGPESPCASTHPQ